MRVQLAGSDIEAFAGGPGWPTFLRLASHPLPVEMVGAQLL